MDYRLTLSKRIKSTPFTSRNDLNGVKAYTVYNKTLLPTIFDTLLDRLKNNKLKSYSKFRNEKKTNIN